MRRRVAARAKTADVGLLERLRRDALTLASRFQLSYQEIAPEPARVKRRYGVCTAEGRIAVRLRHARTGAPLKYSSLINTLCHELAHLRHFNHGPRFKRFYLEILEFARVEGIYRPGPTPGSGWIQLELFTAGHRREDTRFEGQCASRQPPEH